MSPSPVITIGDYCSLDASDVIRLIQAHLTECGLHESCRTLQQESGIFAAGTSFSSSTSTTGSVALSSTTSTTTTTTKTESRGATIWHTKAMEGDWGWILSQLSTLDVSKIQQHTQYQKLLSDTSEMVILELAEGGDIELAYATLRLWSTQLDCVEATISTTTTTNIEKALADKIPKSRQLEQILAALVASKEPSLDEKHSLLYGKRSKVERRDDIGRRLMQIIPIVPPSRLLTLLQQAIHWQIHTGQFPTVQQYWSEEEKQQQAQNIPTSSSLVSASKMNRRGTKRVFDLVLGDVPISRSSSLLSSDPFSTKSCALPRKVLSVISLGKRATAQAAVFLPDGSGLVVGSSDGLVEIWSTASRYQELKLDLPYQQNDEFLGHDDTKITAMTVSNDGTLLATGDSQGTIKIWRLDNGNCVRDIKAYSKDSSLLCLNFSPEASHLLTTASSGTIVREYGLRTGRLLKEFHGHTSFVNTCRYYTILSSLEDDNHDHDDIIVRVLTGSADGTARIWDSKTSELLHILRPYSHGLSRTTIGMCLFQSLSGGVHLSEEMGCPNLHTILPLQSPSNTAILIPRGPRAFVMNLTLGVVLQTLDSNDGSVWVAATVSPTNDDWLYVISDRGALVIFDWKSGQEEMVLPNFARDTTGHDSCEITAVLHHPYKGMLAAFSQDNTVKRGRVAIWK